MSEFDFDFEGVFDEDYLYFYEPMLGERTAEDVDTIVGLLELEPGAEILDCPCGHGRISNALAARGFRVTGIDASELFLERARADAEAQGVDVEYVQRRHAQSARGADRFDALVNWFTSFGYFSDEQNKAVLREFHDALRPGRAPVLETQNITRILLQPRPQHWLERDGDLMLDEWKLDVENARFVTERTVVRGGSTRRTHFVVRWFSAPELRAWLEEAGFENVRALRGSRRRRGSSSWRTGGPAIGSAEPQSDVRGSHEGARPHRRCRSLAVRARRARRRRRSGASPAIRARSPPPATRSRARSTRARSRSPTARRTRGRRARARRVNSHYRRILAANPRISGRNYNDAKTGGKMVDLAGQVQSAIAQQAEYVTILMGANDVCTSSESTMTPVATLRSQLQSALTTLSAGLPNARIFVASIPDVYHLWQILHTNFAAVLTWSIGGICQSLLANPMSTSSTDNARRLRVRQRSIDDNAAIAAVCARVHPLPLRRRRRLRTSSSRPPTSRRVTTSIRRSPARRRRRA